MKAISVLILIILLGCAGQRNVAMPSTNKETRVEVAEMKLLSNDFKQGEMIPERFTCQGENINPQLSWSDVPSDVKSFALIMDDPDAPGGTFVHWLIKDIPAGTREIAQRSAPGAQLANSYGVAIYKGPCPPSLHRYFFKLYALDVGRLDASDSDELYTQVEEHAIAKAELMGMYKKT